MVNGSLFDYKTFFRILMKSIGDYLRPNNDNIKISYYSNLLKTSILQPADYSECFVTPPNLRA